jgi:hypothetical protein
MNFRLFVVSVGAALALGGCSDDGTAAGDTEGSTGSSTSGTSSDSASGTSSSTSAGTSDSDSAGTSTTGTTTGTSDSTGGSTGGGSTGGTGTDTDGTGGSTGGVDFPCVGNDNQTDCENDADGCTWDMNAMMCLPSNLGDACDAIETQVACDAVDLCAWSTQDEQCNPANG